MIEVTQQAADALLGSLKASEIGPEQGLRLKEEGGQFSLEVDSPAPQDHVIEHNEATVLIVDQQVQDQIGDAVIDIEESPNGPQLTLRRKQDE